MEAALVGRFRVVTCEQEVKRLTVHIQQKNLKHISSLISSATSTFRDFIPSRWTEAYQTASRNYKHRTDSAATGFPILIFVGEDQCKCRLDINEKRFQNPDLDARNDIEYVIQPTPIAAHKPFLDRPIGERNASFGAVRFCELSIVERYIRDDVMFLKVNVDNSKSLRDVI